MKRLVALSISALSVVTLALLPSSAVSQQKSLKDQLLGTWIQVSIVGTFKDGTQRELFRPNPKGIVIFTSDGYFSLMQSRADLTKIASSNRATATPEEAKAIVVGSIAYFGRYSVDEAGKRLTVDIQGSTFANQVGSTSDNQRVVGSIAANELKLINPASASGLTIEAVFKRAN